MPREARKKSDSGIYHIMLRGINRQTIFEDEEDCEKYLQCLAEIKQKSGFILYAYCLMGNHVHLLMQEMNEPLELIFKRIGSKYVFWYNRKYKRCGHLFQDRFKSEPIKDDRQFITVLRYIYQNPIKAGICNKPEEYQWSSYRRFGKNSSANDDDKLAEMVSIEQLRVLVAEPIGEKFIDITQDLRLTDREAMALMLEICRIDHANEFEKLQQALQEEYLRTLHGQGCSIRQLVRITGLTKAKIERRLV